MTILLNTSIITTEGTFQLKKLTLENVLMGIDADGGPETVFSAIGHESTAQILTELLGFHVPFNRIQFEQIEGETAYVFKLRGRPGEGKILTKSEIEKIGYDFFYLKRFKDDLRVFEKRETPQWQDGDINWYDEQLMMGIGQTYAQLDQKYKEYK